MSPTRRGRAVAAALAGELESMASWLGLGGVTVSGRGDLAGELRAAAKRAELMDSRLSTL